MKSYFIYAVQLLLWDRDYSIDMSQTHVYWDIKFLRRNILKVILYQNKMFLVLYSFLVTTKQFSIEIWNAVQVSEDNGF